MVLLSTVALFGVLPACTSVHLLQHERQIPALLQGLSERFTSEITLCTGEVVRAWRVGSAADTLHVLDARTGRIIPVPLDQVSEIRTVAISPGNEVGPIVEELRGTGIPLALYGVHVGRPHIARHLYRIDGSCSLPSPSE
jgi:hypothetical protein